MAAESALEQVWRTMTDCRAHRRRHGLPKADLGHCNADDCRLHPDCPVLAAFTGRVEAAPIDTMPRKDAAGEARP